MNKERREIIKKVWMVPTFMALGPLVAKAVPGGSSVHPNNTVCEKPNAPWWCSQ